MRNASDKANGDFGILNVALKPGYRTSDKVKNYALRYINKQIESKEIGVEELSNLCHLEDYSEGVEPRKYLAGILNGEVEMRSPVLDRLCCALELRADEVFPISSVNNETSYKIYEKMTGGDIRKDPVRRNFRVESLGLLRVLGIRDILGWA